MPKKRPTNAELMMRYLADTQLQGLTPDTIKGYTCRLELFLGYLDKTSVLDAGIEQLRGFLAHRRNQVGPSTLGGQFSTLSSFYDFLAYEQLVAGNPIPGFRKRYFSSITRDARKDPAGKRRLLSVEEMRTLVHGVPDVRDRAYIVALAKTGVRRSELNAVDLEDINWSKGSITLKPRRKRTNCTVFFDDETARVLKRWIAIRQARTGTTTGALFVGDQGKRISDDQSGRMVVAVAQAVGLHDPKGPVKQRFTPHCCRHFFTTHMRRAGMDREHVAWLRGDAPEGTIGIYLHIDPDEVRRSYLARTPKLGL